MTFKENLPAPACPALGGMGLLELRGPDAVAFAQSQFMSDVAGLAPGRWHWSGWLTPKGRLVALFALLRLEPDRLWLLSPDAPVDGLAQALGRFVFRRKLAMSAVSSHVAAAGAPEGQAGPVEADGIAGDADTGWVLEAGGTSGSRLLSLLPASHPALAPVDASVDARWHGQDLAHGLPRLGPDQAEAWTPQMLSLDRLGAYSLRKGCYPGQEIVARTHFLGQAKRGLLRLQGMGLASGQAILGPDGQSGTVVCARADGSEGLAVGDPGPASGWTGDGRPLVRLPLEEGLRRPR